ncbi:MAG: hypothetical protein ACYDAY_05385 [Candidatus Dormibacteria bacterium]
MFASLAVTLVPSAIGHSSQGSGVLQYAALAALLFTAGWYGVQRVWFAAAFSGQEYGLRRAIPEAAAQMTRFLRLSLIWFLPATGIVVGGTILVARMSGRASPLAKSSSGSPGFSSWRWMPCSPMCVRFLP